MRLLHIFLFQIKEEVSYLLNGFGVKAGKTQRSEPVAEDVVNFLGCGASDCAAAPLLR